MRYLVLFISTHFRVAIGMVVKGQSKPRTYVSRVKSVHLRLTRAFCFEHAIPAKILWAARRHDLPICLALK